MKQFKEIREAPLVGPNSYIVDTIFDKIKTDLYKAFKKNERDGTALLQQLARLAGYGISKTSQARGKTYRWDLKK